MDSMPARERWIEELVNLAWCARGVLRGLPMGRLRKAEHDERFAWALYQLSMQAVYDRWASTGGA